MSTTNLQIALVDLIKNPHSYRQDKEFTQYANSFDLSTSEQSILKEMTKNVFISKFGKDLIDKRYHFGILKHLKHTRKLVDPGMLRNFLQEKFEPLFKKVKEKELFQTLYDYLSYADHGIEAYGISPLAIDVMRYENLEFQINASDKYKDLWQVPKNSKLNPNTSFLIGDFSFDVLEAIEKLPAEAAKTPVEMAEDFSKNTIILFVRRAVSQNEEVYLSEQFEIDENVANFLNSQLAGEWDKPLPEFHSDLVELGVCL